MKTIKRIIKPLLAGLCISLLLASSLQAEDKFYRYINDSGVKVINDEMPPEFVAGGYDVIHINGTLIERVPRQLSEEELRLQNTEEARARTRQQEAESNRERDESLLLRYSSLLDIEAAQSRAMRDLQIRVSILSSNLSAIKSQIEREQQKAADIERRGRTVPQSMMDNIDILRVEIEDTEQAIASRRLEAESVKESFLRDIERFAVLQNEVNLRR